jgi:hypothetical protein
MGTRTDYHYIQAIDNSSNKHQNLNPYFFAKNLAQTLHKKNILVSKLIMHQKANINQLQLDLFYRVNKLKEYKFKNKKKKLQPLKQNISKLFLEKNSAIKVKVLNNHIKKKEVKALARHCVSFLKKIFTKRADLFCDVIKIATLVARKRASTWSLLHLLILSFKPLRKRKHAVFINFLKELFRLLIRKKSYKIKGVRVRIAGRLKGKPRGSYIQFHLGKIPLTTNSQKIKAVQDHIYTIYGCFGLKLWINFK